MASTQGKIFDFFGLSPELRDLIYSYITRGISRPDQMPREEVLNSFDPRPNPEPTLKGGPLVQLLTLDSQLRDEYVDYIKKNAVLYFQERGNHSHLPVLKGLLLDVGKVEAPLQIIPACNGNL